MLYITDSEVSYTPSEIKQSLFRAYIDAGADLIVGTNASIIQPSEKYGDGFIVYSLGTLIDGASKYGEKYSVLLSVELRSNEDGIVDVLFDILLLSSWADEQYILCVHHNIVTQAVDYSDLSLW